ncbi:MAG: hypothetical protein Tsb002_03360 [Wenzhouxiangellaceae bacterium]
MFILAVCGLIFTLFTCLFLWFFAQWVASRLLSGTAPITTNQSPPEDSAVIYTAFLVTLGVYLLFTTLSDASYWLTLWFYTDPNSKGHGYMEYHAAQIAAIATTVIELIMSIALLIGSRRLARLLHQLRHAY